MTTTLDSRPQTLAWKLLRLQRRCFRVPLLLRKARLRWWLVYGPARCGTTLMHQLIAGHARINVGDWGLRHCLQHPMDRPGVTFDRRRFDRDVSRNVLVNAPPGGGRAIDVAFKQANLHWDEYQALVRLWGEPERKIFCYRDPASFMASAVKKFPDTPREDLQERNYIGTIERLSRIGGDAFEYRDGLSLDDYERLLQPLGLPANPPEFRYTGHEAPDLVTDAMWKSYESLK